jgi:predicted aconitase with swiveling domain
MLSRSHALTAGQARGEVIVLDEPLSFWGGFDSATGRITDRHHPQVGTSLAGKVLVMPSGRGSSSSSSVLAEAIRARTAPVAIVLREADLIVALGALVAAELYRHHVPVVAVAPDDYAALQTGQTVEVVAEEAQARIVLAKAETA